MLDTIAKTAAVGSVLSLFRRVSGRNQTNYLGAAGLLVAGAVVGAAAALLLAPKPGSELREDVRKGAKRLTTGAQERLGRVTTAARQAVASAAESANSGLEHH